MLAMLERYTTQLQEDLTGLVQAHPVQSVAAPDAPPVASMRER
jgi:hypothetical protein